MKRRDTSLEPTVVTTQYELCEMLKWWYCASPMERRTYEKWIFTTLSASGLPTHGDRGVEESVTHMQQSGDSHIHRKGKKVRMECATAFAPDKVAQQDNIRLLWSGQ